MNKHTLSYGLAVTLFSSTIVGTAFSLHTKNDVIDSLEIELAQYQKDITLLTAEKEDVMSVNSQLSEKIEVLESSSKQMQEQINNADIQIEKLTKEKSQLEVKLQAKKESQVADWTTFTATYYDANEVSTGKTPGHPEYGVTASGEYVKEGVTIAVDPKVIPLGTWVEVKYPDGHIEKRKATDTGGAIKGNKIDIYITKATLESGKHPVQVRVIN